MISAQLVKELRERTGAGMMDCKKALTETNGNISDAIDFLRKKGLSNAVKKSGRVAANGLISYISTDNKAAVIEVNSETDFVALNDKFQTLVSNISNVAINCNNLEELENIQLPNGKKVSDEIIENIASIGENIKLRRMDQIKVTHGVIVPYVHNKVNDNAGKIIVLVAIESQSDNKDKLTQLGKQIAMHIAAAKPIALNQNELSQDLINKEREIFIEQSRASGKPDSIIEQMIEGRIRKYLEEAVLMNQIFIIDNKSKISELLANASKELGSNVTISSFIRYEIGEGIEQEQTNFAEEVAAARKM